MSGFESEYYVLYPSFTPGLVLLQPDDSTVARPYLSSKLPSGKPLRFQNGFDEDRRKAGAFERVDDLLYDSASYAFKDRLRIRIEAFDIHGAQFYPIIFEDGSGRRHLDYWYLNLYRRQPFLDPEKSELLLEPEESDEPDDPVFVQKFAFDRRKMAAVPEEQRLIFRLVNTPNAGWFYHERIVNILNEEHATGFKAFRVSEFEDGMQYA